MGLWFCFVGVFCLFLKSTKEFAVAIMRYFEAYSELLSNTEYNSGKKETRQLFEDLAN